MLAHGHTKSEAQYADQMARRVLHKALPAAGSAQQESANSLLALLVYDDFERIWTADFSQALTAKNLARTV